MLGNQTVTNPGILRPIQSNQVHTTSLNNLFFLICLISHRSQYQLHHLNLKFLCLVPIIVSLQFLLILRGKIPIILVIQITRTIQYHIRREANKIVSPRQAPTMPRCPTVSIQDLLQIIQLRKKMVRISIKIIQMQWPNRKTLKISTATLQLMKWKKKFWILKLAIPIYRHRQELLPIQLAPSWQHLYTHLTL